MAAGKITARIMDEEHGLLILESVSAVRIRSKNYVLLMMNDYLPSLGEIDGDVYFITRENETVYKGIKGFYKNQHNEFTLLITGKA